MSRPLSIWVTGQPIPAVRKAHGDFAAMIRVALGPSWAFDYQVVNCEDLSQPLPSPEEVAGIVITGSPAHVHEPEPWMQRVALELSQLRALPPSRRPAVLGICFGHQLLGHAFGGLVQANPLGRELGFVELALELAPDVDVATRTLFETTRAAWVPMAHYDSIVTLPEGAVGLGRTAQEAHAAVRFAEGVWGVQFHPEMTVEALGHYQREGLGGKARAPEDGEGSEADDSWAREVLRRFAALCASRAAG